MRIRRFLALFLLLLGMLPAVAQTPTTQGREFWLSFMRNGYRANNTTNHLYLIASAKRPCTVTVSSPHSTWSQTKTIDNGITTIVIPDAVGYNDQQSGIADKGLFVSATDTISLFIANETQNSYDAANVLPLQALGCRYMVQTNKSLHYQNSSHSEDNRASFLIVATEDNTQVQITPSCQTIDNQSDTYTVTLQRGQCYHVLNKNPGYANNADGDFSGTWIESLYDKPIAVFNGNSVTAVADAAVNEGYDHVFEQAMPADYWGKMFVVTRTRASQTLQADRVKVTALLDNTDVWQNGELVYQALSAGESRAFWLTENSCYLESSGPVAVYLYNHSHSSSNTYGDPSMVWISPVEQNLQDVIFSTFTSQTQLNHFVNVVCYTEDISGLLLNGSPIPQNEIETVPSAPQFSFARVTARSGMNRLQCPGGLVAHVYGMGDRQGYAYTVGSSAKQLTKQLYVNDILSSELPDGFTVCQEEELHFRVETNYEFDHVEWGFGDDGNAVGVEVSHAYSSAGNYDVQSVVFRLIDDLIQPFDTLSVTIHVNPFNQLEVHETTCAATYRFRGHDYPVPFDDYIILPGEEHCDTICHLQIEQGSQVTCTLPSETVCGQYVWYGDTIVNEGLNHLQHRVPNATPEGCDSLYVRDVVIGNPPVNAVTNYSSCDTWYWHGIACDATDVYRKEFTTPEGCVYDSILYFTLLEGGESFETAAACDSYSWQNQILSESGDYSDTIIGSNGCISILNLHLTISNSPPFSSIRGLSNVAVSTNFWPGEYVYFLDDTIGMDTSTITWTLSDNANGEWEFRPHGASCTIITYTMATKTLTATTGNGPCDKTVSKRINCSGFGVDETEQELLKVYPNPARDELIVEGEGLKSVAVINLLGQRLKEEQVDGENEARISVDDLPPALYLVQVTTRNGNKTQLVSVTR